MHVREKEKEKTSKVTNHEDILTKSKQVFSIYESKCIEGSELLPVFGGEIINQLFHKQLVEK